MSPELITALSASIVALITAVGGFLTILYKLGVIHNVVNSNLAEVNKRLDASMAETRRLNENILIREDARNSLKEVK